MHTVICAFDDRADAERAMQALAEQGYSRELMHLQVGYEGTHGDSAAAAPPVPATAAAAAAAADPTGTLAAPAPPADVASEPPGLLRRVADFFIDLFGVEQGAADAAYYAELIRRGGTVLVVDTAGEQEADRARTLMDRLGGTVDIDERNRQRQAVFDAQGSTPDEPFSPANRMPVSPIVPNGDRPAGQPQRR